MRFTRERLAPLLHHPRARLVAAGVVAAFALALVVGYVRFSRRVSELRARHASGPAWVFPSRVYSDGVPFVEGRVLPESYLVAQLEARGYREASAPLERPGTWGTTGGGIEIFLRGFREAPDPAGTGGPERVQLTIDDGRLRRVRRLGGVRRGPPPDSAHPARLEPVLVSMLFDEHRVRRTWVPIERIPRAVQDAVVAAEDRRFHQHVGLDIKSNLRALVTNVQARGVREGGSTVTQQLARGLFLGSQRTWNRKLSEAWLALGLELVLSKRDILEMYLNSVYWGRSEWGGVAGIAEAARYYFGAPVESLGVAEAATLAGMIPAPNSISPFRNPRLTRSRRNAVLRDMVETRVLDAAMAERLSAEPLRVRRGPPPLERFPSFTGHVREVLTRRVSPGAAERWGLSVFTTLDVVWQTEAEAWLAAGVDELERWAGRGPEPLQGAFVAIEPGTGFVRALVGGRSARPGDFNRATQARRQPGSAIKPVVYASALDGQHGGRRLTPAATVPDLRRDFPTPQGPWKPRNDEGDYHASVTLAKALAKSLNVATANLVEEIGPNEVARHAERFGLGRLKPVASIGLGTNEVTLLALTAAYAPFDNGGIHHEPTPLRAVVDGRGELLDRPPAQGRRVLPAETAALMAGLLEDVVIYGVAYPLRATFNFLRPVGGKTGTTNDYLDAWFVGFTPDVVAGVWVGYDTPRSLRRPAAQSALPVWHGIVNRLLDGFPAAPLPGTERLELAWIDPWTGGLAGPGCPVMRVPFLPGTAPKQVCRGPHPVAPPESLFIGPVQDSGAVRRDSVADSSSAALP